MQAVSFTVQNTAFCVALPQIDLLDGRSLDDDLIEPVITPRFVPTCTPELLSALGKLAAKHKVSVQSHISESLDEIAFCSSLHPEVCHSSAFISMCRRIVAFLSILWSPNGNSVPTQEGREQLMCCQIASFLPSITAAAAATAHMIQRVAEGRIYAPTSCERENLRL